MNGLLYKESNYNFEFPYEDEGNEVKRVLYNSRTNALALIHEEKYAHFRSFKSEGSQSPMKSYWRT